MVRICIAFSYTNFFSYGEYGTCAIACNTFYFQECVPERIELKTSVYSKIDKIMNDSCILATSASALLPSKLAANITHKNRFIVAHPVIIINISPSVCSRPTHEFF